MEGESPGRLLEALVSSPTTAAFVICFTINYMEQINPTQSPDCVEARVTGRNVTGSEAWSHTCKSQH